jgi:hypothetical protein
VASCLRARRFATSSEQAASAKRSAPPSLPLDPKRPVVGFDAMPIQLVEEVRVPLPAEPGKPLRIDYEYQRNGTANLFLLVEPKAGTRHVEVTERRTRHDFALQSWTRFGSRTMHLRTFSFLAQFSQASPSGSSLPAAT